MRIRLAGLGVVIACVALVAGSSPAQAVEQNIARNLWTSATVVGPLGVPLPAPTCTLGSGPENVVDQATSNIYTDKWCVPSGKPTLQISLPAWTRNYELTRIEIVHAGVAESPTLNTRAYTLAVTENMYRQTCVAPGILCVTTTIPINRTIAAVTSNTATTTSHDLPELLNPSDIRLTINTPTQTSNQATRIYEVRVFGNYVPTVTSPLPF